MARIIAREEGMQALIPVITKELYHYAILSTMREEGYLDRLVFQGGTSLRLCHGSPRYSEDLDFAGGRDFSLESFTAMGEAIERRLASLSPGSSIAIRTPKPEGMVSRWRIRIRTALHTKDMPSQIIKLEVAAVPAYDPVPATVEVNYRRLYGLFDRIPITVESLDEIMADKMLSYVAANHLRYRDLWDMGWIGAKRLSDRSNVWDVLDRKQDDYSERPDWASRLSGDRSIPAALRSRAFRDELARFIEPAAIGPTVGDEAWRRAIADELETLYGEYITHTQNRMGPATGFAQETGRAR
ncbi:nucleotidyl transferase, PF08843 family [Bifidobacterium cuniculi]|uniref:Nucleotidyl transferase, PF08843 family n=2 Tax=Bifidobacterium cuniculi TaxID=1688 RepID=A0A087AVU6_9BIFI|nr:nucleotidyl transferase, PF08843 family [Bifidobacterium cuniculi]